MKVLGLLSRARFLVALVVLAIVAGACTLPPPPPPPDPPGTPPLGPDGDAFYQPPSPLPAGARGSIIWQRPSTFGSYTDVKAWKILYRSTNATGQNIAVSGTLIVPNAAYPSGPRPLIGFAVGTQGLGDACAPSKALPTGFMYEQGNIRAAIDRGWAVVVTDYEGLGTPGDHTYIIGQSEGRAVLDSIRAASKIPAAGLSPTAPVGIWGYSQGGQAAAAAGELESTYAPELNVKGVAAGGVPADLNRVAQNLDGGAFFAFLGAAAVGLDAAYPELNLDSYLNAQGQTLLADARDDCLLDALLKYGFQSISNLTTTNPLPTPAWQARLAENKLGNTGPQVPTLLYHGLIDEIIPYDQAVTLRNSYCAKGTTVTWIEYWLAEHLLTIFSGAPDAVNWLSDRFAGLPQPDSC